MNFDILRKNYINLIKPIEYSKINPNHSTFVESPLRANLSAGWNDTPPYCNEVIGYTLNAPILLNNTFPIKVYINKINEKKIILKNLDSNSSIAIQDISQLLNCQSASADFALHKASILASGLIPFDRNYDLNIFFDKLGGFELSSSVKDIPVGSGLGTSSILIYSCIKAIHDFYNLHVSGTDLFNMTTCAEQIMTTGGGYQDQIGAYGKGIRFISFEPGIYPKICLENIKLDDTLKNELQNRLVFIYTGNTRISKNSTQKIMGNYINNDSNTINILHEIGNTAKDMKKDLLNSDLSSLAINMTKSFDLNVRLNPYFSNNNINNILSCINNLISGYMLSGAGNGGFLTVLLNNNTTKKDINEKLNLYFKDSNIKIYNFNLWL